MGRRVMGSAMKSWNLPLSVSPLNSSIAIILGRLVLVGGVEKACVRASKRRIILGEVVPNVWAALTRGRC